MNNFKYDGRHLMIDAITNDSQKLCQPQFAIEFLEKVVEKIDMTMILPPVTVKFPHATCEMTRILHSLQQEGLATSETAKQIHRDLDLRKQESYGYSTFVMIAESHLSIHTFPELNYISFDCYSCKFFDTKLVENILKDYFSVVNCKVQSVKRLIPGKEGQ